jgi:hypothetical protein
MGYFEFSWAETKNAGWKPALQKMNYIAKAQKNAAPTTPSIR